MKIAVYTQAGPEIGMGHVVRDAHLVALFKARGHHVDIITNETGYKYFRAMGQHSIDAKDEKTVVNISDIAIIDHMITDNNYLKAIRRTTKKLVVIVGAGHTITPETRWIADLIIYQCPMNFNLYDQVPGENIISGFDHLILHPQYAQLMNEEDRGNDFVVYFGGGAKESFAGKIVNGLIDKGYQVKWVGASNWDDDLYEALSLATTFIGTMGMVTYEALATFTYPIVFSRSEDHVEIAEQLERSGQVTNLGLLPMRAMKIDKYISQIIEAHENRPIRLLREVDGKGAYRVAREILK